MAETYSLLEFLQQLTLDDGLRADFTSDPQSTLAAHGLAGLTAEDVRDAAVLVEDTRTADVGADHTVAGDPALSFLDSFVTADHAVPADLGESGDVGVEHDLQPAYDDLGPDDGASFGSGHADHGGHAAEPAGHLDGGFADEHAYAGGAHEPTLDDSYDPDDHDPGAADDPFVHHDHAHQDHGGAPHDPEHPAH